MLTEERYAMILKILNEKSAITVLELSKLLSASESTIRRDLTALHQDGKLYKVYGGATSIDNKYTAKEENISEKKDSHCEDKIQIAKYAAQMIQSNDFIYLDAGTTTEYIIGFLPENTASYITNGITHAKKLAARGLHTIIVGGQIKANTEAVVGSGALRDLKQYNFTKGFFGVNGISIPSGFSTPDSDEGLVKNEAMLRCKKSYILADPSKFNKIAPMTFGALSGSTILTTRLTDKKYLDYTTVIEVSKNDLHRNL